jgi:hypothetical protein
VTKVRGDPHEVVRCVGDELRQTEIHRHGKSSTTDDGFAYQGDDWHSHPERIEARRMTVVRERVEANVDLVVGRKVVEARLVAYELDAFGRNAERLERLGRASSGASFRRAQDQT